MGSAACLRGGSFWYPKTMIRQTTNDDVGFYATNLWGSRYLLFNWAYLRGYSNEFYLASQVEDQDSLVLSLAQIIVHEVGHSCMYGEEIPKIMAYYFGRAVAKDPSNYLIGASSFCCVNDALNDGYDPSSYSGGGDVYDDPNYFRLLPSTAPGTEADAIRLSCTHQ